MQFLWVFSISLVLLLLDFFFMENSSSISRYLERMAPLIAGVITLSLLTFHLVLKSHTEPIHKLMKAAQEMSQKGRSSVLQIDSGDEFELLAHSFNEMSQSITSQIKDLEKAQARLEEANQVKSQFLANLSHELRTPLNAIKASSEFLLDDDSLNEDAQEFSQMIFDGAKLLNEHLDQIFRLQDSLDTSQDNTQKRFYLTELVKEVVRPMAHYAEKKQLDIDIDIPHPLSEVEYIGFYSRLTVMLHILLDNAIKFTEYGFVRIEMGYQMLNNQKDIIQISVVDSGCGIPSQDQEGIFHPSRPFNDPKNKSQNGLSLGLALANNHTKFFGTSFYLESTPGRGSRFSFEVILERIQSRKS